MTINAATFRTLLRRYRIKPIELAAKIEREPKDVIAWFAGMADIPPYIELTLIAIRAGLNPIDPGELDAGTLGIEQGRLNYWLHIAQKIPLSARLAMAGAQWKSSELTKRDRDLLRQIDAGRYYRITGGWRSVPVAGEALPQMHPKTPINLIARGLVTRTNRGWLILTDRGKKEAGIK